MEADAAATGLQEQSLPDIAGNDGAAACAPEGEPKEEGVEGASAAASAVATPTRTCEEHRAPATRSGKRSRQPLNAAVMTRTSSGLKRYRGAQTAQTESPDQQSVQPKRPQEAGTATAPAATHSRALQLHRGPSGGPRRGAG